MGCIFPSIILVAMYAFGCMIYETFGLVALLIYVAGLIVVLGIALFEN